MIEAMKQLIEDCISMMEYHIEQTRPIHTTTVAIQAAKEALKAIAEAEKHEVSQEPVAWQAMVENEAMKEFPIKDMAHDWCVHQQLSGSPYAYWLRPLYTHPQPKREPLTDEQIAEFFGVKAVDESFVDFVRAIEAAHGITSDMKQEHGDKTAKQRHEENT
jgi:hypothetical protein